MCGRRRLAATSTFLSGLFASKGSNIYDPMPEVQTSTTSLSSSTFLHERGGGVKKNTKKSHVKSLFMLQLGNVFKAETS